MKVYQWYFGPKILNFERSLRLSTGPQRSLVPPCKISLGGPAYIYHLYWILNVFVYNYTWLCIRFFLKPYKNWNTEIYKECCKSMFTQMLFLLIDYHYLSSCQLIYQPRVLCDNDICIKNMYINDKVYEYVIYIHVPKYSSRYLHKHG